jgi:glc operon protein GlcG
MRILMDVPRRTSRHGTATGSLEELPMLPVRHTALLAAFVFGMIGRTAIADEKRAPDSPLVSLGRIQLNLAGAETIVAAAKQRATAMNLKVNIAIVDDGGQLLAFARMDGARPASAATALTKAVSAATFRQETGPLPVKGEPDLLLSLSLQNAALAGGGRTTTLKGGVPIVVDSQVIGGVGIAGGSGDQVADVAKAGFRALLAELAGKK